MANFACWCAISDHYAARHRIVVLLSEDDEDGIARAASALPIQYIAESTIEKIARRHGKVGIANLLRDRVPTAQGARSGDLGEIFAATYLEEEEGFVVGPCRLRHRDHQEWAMRGDDVLAARLDAAGGVRLVKAEAKSRKRTSVATLKEARQGLDRGNGLPYPQSLQQFADRLEQAGEQELADAILDLALAQGVRAGQVSHMVFLFTQNDPVLHVQSGLEEYKGDFVQSVIVLRVAGHQEFVRSVYEKALTDGE